MVVLEEGVLLLPMAASEVASSAARVVSATTYVLAAAASGLAVGGFVVAVVMAVIALCSLGVWVVVLRRQIRDAYNTEIESAREGVRSVLQPRIDAAEREAGFQRQRAERLDSELREFLLAALQQKRAQE